jgi:hypothetical protein
MDNNTIKIPKQIVETMIIMCDEIKNDIEIISTNNELNNGTSPNHNIQFANNLILQFLQNYLNDN